MSLSSFVFKLRSLSMLSFVFFLATACSLKANIETLTQSSKSSNPIQSQTPVFLKDINKTASLKFYQVGTKYVFLNATAATGNEPWVTDGTAAGTFMLRDINPGPASSITGFSVVSGSFLYFGADNGTQGYELWKTDGTTAGTQMVKDLSAGTTSGLGSFEMAAYNNLVFFEGDDGTGAYHVQRSDGTAAGTIVLDTTWSDFTKPRATSFGLIYYATHPSFGYEPWITDGTPGGTHMIKDIRVGSSSSGSLHSYHDLMGFEMGGFYYFPASDSSMDYFIFKTDGTSGGTTKVSNFCVNSDIDSSETVPFRLLGTKIIYVQYDACTTGYKRLAANNAGASTMLSPTAMSVGWVEVLGTKVIFEMRDTVNSESEPWVSDGTPGGTSKLKDIAPGTTSSSPQYLGVAGGKLYFSASSPTEGREIWVTDGTTAGTSLLKDINVGISDSISLTASTSFFSIGSQAYFAVNDGINGLELWTSDGTTVGTVLLKDLYSGSESGLPVSPILFGAGGFLFGGYNALIDGPSLWKSDGTAGGTQSVSNDLLRSQNTIPQFSTWGRTWDEKEQSADFNNKLFFAAGDGSRDRQLWASDGSSSGTQRILDFAPNGGCMALAGMMVSGSSLFFDGFDPAAGTELWKTDGTAAGSGLIQDSAVGTLGFFSRVYWQLNRGLFHTSFNGKIYYNAFSSASGHELWSSDGTNGGTALFKDFLAGTGESSPHFYGGTSGFMLFGAATTTGSSPKQLWVSDGTIGGTFLASTETSTQWIGSRNATLGSEIFFQAYDGNGYELWKSNGTVGGTGMVKDINPGANGSYADHFTLFNGKIYFFATEGTNGYELWATDGTSGGTSRVVDLNSGAGSGANNSDPGNEPVVANNRLFYVGSDAATSWELTTSDGTAGGTYVVKDINVGAGSADIHGLQSLGPKVLFIALNGTTYDLYSSDGTLSGTIKLNPAGVKVYTGSGDGTLTPVGINGVYYFHASDAATGIELWRSDGTPEGTYMVYDFFPGPGNSYARPIRAINNKLYLYAEDAVHGVEFWALPL